MCGVMGFVSNSLNHASLQRGLDSISHRGPDSLGVFVDGSIYLGHRRLAIHDLTESGHQPMFSPSKRFVTVFNGEIYNYKKLIVEFDLDCKSTSDTEVVLLLVERFGIKQTVEKLIGMFALVIFDTVERKLHLLRDRMGEKPLYYFWDNEDFIFSSELKGLFAVKEDLKINEEALRSYFYYNYIPEQQCILGKTTKVAPGEILTFDLKSKKFNKEIYWSVDSAYRLLRKSYKGSFQQALVDLDNKLTEVVEDHMSSDVPIGAFLSGGVDSSLICAIAQKISSKPINTFSIGFDNKSYNEAGFAKEVSKHLKTNHTDLYVTAEDCINSIRDIARTYDEPMSDASQIPTVLLSHLTKNYVTVCLSGDAGDELFGGYTRYFTGDRINWYLENIPLSFRKLSKELLSLVNNSTFKFLHPGLHRKLYKLSSILDSGSGFDFYEDLITHWKGESPLLNKKINPFRYEFSEGETFVEKMMLLDMKTYLPSDILVKVDRAAMSASLETRAPFLDKRIVEFALSLPLNYKIEQGQGKIILKELLYKYVPRHLIDRPKMGFGVPLDAWFRSELKEWCSDRLSKVEEDDALDHELIRLKMSEHLSGKKNWQYHLWDVVLYQSWKEEFGIKNNNLFSSKEVI